MANVLERQRLKKKVSITVEKIESLADGIDHVAKCLSDLEGKAIIFASNESTRSEVFVDLLRKVDRSRRDVLDTCSFQQTKYVHGAGLCLQGDDELLEGVERCERDFNGNKVRNSPYRFDFFH